MRTARDAEDYLLDFLGENPTGQALRQVKLACQDALTELANSTNWSYYYASGRLATSAPYSTGTIQYQQSSGMYPYQVTLTGGTWPSWAAYGELYIGFVSYEVDQVKSSTVLTLKSNFNPGVDVAAGTAYNLYQATYPLPADFKTCFAVTVATNLSALHYVHPTRWSDLIRNFRTQGIPTTFTILGDRVSRGGLTMGFFPYPNQLWQTDFIYSRRPRAFSTWQYKTGTVSLTSGSNLAEGTGTAWTAAHVGCVLRTGSDAATTPTGLDGANPYTQQFNVIGQNSATELVLGQNAASTQTGVAYVLSDPVDVDEQLMFTAFLRCAEKHLAVKRRIPEAQVIAKAYAEALLEARAGDSRFAQRWGLDPDRYRVRWANHPLGSDIS